jgi:hypothetical protein
MSIADESNTKETIDDRIKRISRKFLSDMSPSKERLLALRDYCWDMSDYLADCGDIVERELRKKRRTNPKWKRDRPKPSEIRDLDAGDPGRL